jgi:signal peptidase I
MSGHELGCAMRSSAKQKETKMRDVPQAATAEEKSQRRIFQEYSEAFVVAVILAILIRALLFQAFKIPSSSMESTLLVGDHILVNKFIYGVRIPFTKDRWPVFTQPRRGDVIVFVYPEDRTKDFIKRVVGIGGDTVEIRDKHVILNGKPVENPNAQFGDPRVFPESISKRDNMDPTKVPEGSLFVMGDNRDFSHDSRFWGFVPVEDVKGEAFIIYYSAQDFPGWPWQWKRFFKLIP